MSENDVTQEEIARRAHEISLSEEGGTEEENWYRAERELEGERNNLSTELPREEHANT